MEVTEVKVFPVEEEKLRAFVSLVFDHCFMVNDVKIIAGKDGLFISMPSRRKKNGEFKDVAHPLNNECRRMIETRVIGEYERVRGVAAGTFRLASETRPASAEDHGPARSEPEPERPSSSSLDDVEDYHRDSFWSMS